MVLKVPLHREFPLYVFLGDFHVAQEILLIKICEFYLLAEFISDSACVHTI